jgi:hypothetical protein
VLEGWRDATIDVDLKFGGDADWKVAAHSSLRRAR